MLLWIIAAFQMVPISLACKENTYHRHNMAKKICQLRMYHHFCSIINICAKWYVLLIFGAMGNDVEYGGGIMPPPLPPWK